ncbi:hypothetical protein [uncultured Reyranella sp.]|uniref:hypothetical protein n=1 Tax=uncultured Reyranella sp. TaxID=735512 RepID=UPI00259C9AC6|nr:hypothetical protein [uncultured Reyranella sp.]
MARTFAEETVETSNTTGTGAYSLEGAKGDYLPFEASYVTGDKPAYVVRNKNNTKWEMNRAAAFTQGSPSTLARGVWKSSNSDAPVPWTVDDLPLTVYVPASAEVHEGVVTGWLKTARHALLRAGAFFWTSADPAVSWERYLATGDAAQTRVGFYDAVKGLYFSDDRRRSISVGAFDRTIVAADANAILSYNTTAAARTVTLPAGSTVKDGFVTHHIGLDVANGLVFTPDAGDGIDGGADGATLSVPGKVPVSLRWDAARDCWASSYVPAQAPNWAGRRQTAASGPRDTAGLPTFLPSSSVSLNLTTQNVNTTALIVAAAAGWLTANGRPSDWIGRATANFTWSGLTPSRAAATPNFLYVIVNADGTLSTGATILAPIYQWAGTPATTSGQFTFNVSEMKGYLGNGTSAPQTNLVMLGEAATDGSTVISTVAYAYNGRYEGAWTATLWTVSTGVSRSHNLGVLPLAKDFVLECTTNDNGYLVGEQISMADQTLTSAGVGVYHPHPLAVTRNGMHTFAASTSAFVASDATTGTNVALTLARWKYKPVADRGW